jgi:hypothetical protein
MTPFETLTDAFLQLQHIDNYNPSMDVDATGVLMDAFIKMVLLADELIMQKLAGSW